MVERVRFNEIFLKQVQDYDSKRSHKTLIFTIINSVEEALRAANEWNVDALVVQGTSTLPSLVPIMVY